MERSYKYAVLRVIPDSRRGECVNIGIAIFTTSKVDIRLIVSLNKVAAIDGSIDLHRIATLPESLKDYLSSKKGVEAKYSAFKEIGFVSLSELGWFMSKNDGDYESSIKRLMVTLVEPKLRARHIVANTKITISLRDQFKKQNILGKDIKDITKHLIIPNYPLFPDEGLYADFVLKNGVYRITETADLRAESGSSADRRRIAADAAIKLDKARKKFKRSSKRYVVYGASLGSDASQQVNLLGDYSDGIYNIGSRTDMANYMGLIMEAASSNCPL